MEMMDSPSRAAVPSRLRSRFAPVFAGQKDGTHFGSIGRQNGLPAQVSIFETKLRLDGFEPSTLSLKVRCSTAELKSLIKNDPKGIRTPVIGMKIRCPRPG